MIITRKPKMNDFLVARSEHRVRPNNMFTGIRTGILPTVGNKGSYYSDVKTNDIYVYHAEKVRRKLYKNKDKTPRKSHWKVRIFKFSNDRVKTVNQYSRHFVVVFN